MLDVVEGVGSCPPVFGCNYVDVNAVPTLKRPQEATVLNKSRIEALTFPSLESEIISTLPFPCLLPVVFFFSLFEDVG